MVAEFRDRVRTVGGSGYGYERPTRGILAMMKLFCFLTVILDKGNYTCYKTKHTHTNEYMYKWGNLHMMDVL